ncbi:hypothetical protein ACFXTO_032350 [Malus domestica]
MSGLDRTLVEHELRIKPGCKPVRQPPRRFSTKVQLGIKDEIIRLSNVGFIGTARYVEWLANIIPVLKKNRALRICIDFRNLNLATPKDAYPMPISYLLIDAATNHDMLSFMDGHTGYNQIFITEADVHKTAFRCPGALGTYEWDSDKFDWHEEHRAAFTQIKVALATPLVLVLPRRDKPLKLYIFTAEESIGCFIAQDTDAGREQAIFYLSRHLNPLEINYSPVEKLCLALFFVASKLRHYMLPSVTQVIA